MAEEYGAGARVNAGLRLRFAVSHQAAVSPYSRAGYVPEGYHSWRSFKVGYRLQDPEYATRAQETSLHPSRLRVPPDTRRQTKQFARVPYPSALSTMLPAEGIPRDRPAVVSRVLAEQLPHPDRVHPENL